MEASFLDYNSVVGEQVPDVLGVPVLQKFEPTARGHVHCLCFLRVGRLVAGPRVLLGLVVELVLGPSRIIAFHFDFEQVFSVHLLLDALERHCVDEPSLVELLPDVEGGFQDGGLFLEAVRRGRLEVEVGLLFSEEGGEDVQGDDEQKEVEEVGLSLLLLRALVGPGSSHVERESE